MLNPVKLQLLVELRKEVEPRLSQKRVAELFGLDGEQGRKTVSNWEAGVHPPDKTRRDRFIRYLWDDLGLRRNPARFEEVWAILAEEWDWKPISDAEWKSLTPIPRPRHAEPSTVASLSLHWPPPPEPARPPAMAGFVGRAQELAYFADKLTSKHLAVITGMAGMGKTALAATLCRQFPGDPHKVFWHSFHEGQGIEVIIWQLAAFLAWHGRSDLWQLLQTTRQSGARPPPIETLFDFLLQLLRGSGYLLCLDDFHFVEDDPTLNRLIERLRGLLGRDDCQLVLTARRLPKFVTRAEFAPLTGLSLADAQLLVESRELHLTSAQIEQLHAVTAGNAVLLSLALDALQQAKDLDDLLAHLSTSADIEHYLLSEVDEVLTGPERNVMIGLAVLLGYPASREALESVISTGNLYRILHRLQERHLLLIQEGGAERRYHQHSILQAFFYELVSPRQRRQLHRRAGEYYANMEPDPLRAALHYQRAGEHDQAASHAASNVWGLINQGQARALAGFLECFKPGQIDVARFTQVRIARGQVDAFLGQRAEARQHFEAALSAVASLPADGHVHQLRAHACRGMGELLELEEPQTALDWFQRGVVELKDHTHAEYVALQIGIGAQQMYLGDYAAALTALEGALRHLPNEAALLRCIALRNLGSVYLNLGQLPRALEHTQAALTISQALHHQFETATLLMLLAIQQYISGQWRFALEGFQQALRLAGSLGSYQLQAEAATNLGTAYINLGEDQAAADYLQQGLQVAQQHQLRLIQALALYRLADLALRRQVWETAAAWLGAAEEVAKAIAHTGVLIAIYRGWAEIKLATGEQKTAQEYAEYSLNLAREQEEALEEGESWRLLGQVELARGQRAAALDAFQQSLALLAKTDPYEAARTQVQWALAFSAGEGSARRQALLQTAEITFETLGAQRDLKRVRSLLGA